MYRPQNRLIQAVNSFACAVSLAFYMASSSILEDTCKNTSLTDVNRVRCFYFHKKN